MTKLAKYMKSSVVYLVLIVGLLFLQAYCDLELPDYTSNTTGIRVILISKNAK